MKLGTVSGLSTSAAVANASMNWMPSEVTNVSPLRLLGARRQAEGSESASIKEIMSIAAMGVMIKGSGEGS